MAKSKVLQSNIIVRTTLPKPTGPGFSDTLSKLQTISKTIDDINKKHVKVRVDLKGSKDAINSLDQILKVITATEKAQAKAANVSKKSQQTAVNVAATATRQINQQLQTSAQRVKTTTARKVDEEGNLTGTRTEESFRQVGQRNIREAITRNLDTGDFVGDKTTELEDEALAREKRARRLSTERVNRAGRLADQRKQIRENRQAGIKFAEESVKQGFDKVETIGRQIAFAGNPLKTFRANLIKVSQTLSDGREIFKTYDEATNTYSRETVKASAASKLLERQQVQQLKTAAKLSEIQQSKAKGVKLEGDLTRRGFQRQTPQEIRGPLAGPGTDVTAQIKTFTRELADGRQQVISFNEATGRTKSHLVTNTQAIRDNARVQKILSNNIQATSDIARFQADGFKIHSVQNRDLTIGNQKLTTSFTELRKVTGSPLLGNLQVQLAKVDSSTGKVVTKTLSAIDAMRLLGNTFTVAAAKVGVFLGATAATIAVFRGFSFAAETLKELEKNTVFLARVGSKLGASFDSRLIEARKLTYELIEQTKVIGGNAVEAQQAAAIFLRAGQNRKQALESTRAALIASQIAELDVEEAAKLLSAAMSQFNIEAKNLIPTLDSLNTLSNTTRVSTDDLLQSISRAGSVYADANGTLEQLAATTATVAHITARTGAEIGNALKTIQSRLSSPEVVAKVFEKTGISMRDAEGRTKNLTEVLLQLQLALQEVNDADRTRLGVVVAGARQVNVLKAALKGVTDIVLKEAAALRDESAAAGKSGSATQELIDSSRTLEAVFGRLKASFVGLFADSEGAINNTLKTITGFLTSILKLAGAFNGVFINAGLLITAVLLARLAILKFLQSTTFAAASVAALRFGLVGLSNAMDTVSVASVTATGVFTKFNAAILIVTTALTLIAAAFAAAEQATTEAKIELDEYNSSLERSLTVTQRRRQATESLSNALLEQLEAQRQVNKELAAGNKVSKERQDLIQKNIRKLTSSESDGGGLGIDIPKGGVKSEKDIRKVQREDLKKLIDDRLKALRSSEDNLKAEERIQKERENLINDKKREVQELIKIQDDLVKSFTRKGVDPEKAFKTKAFKGLISDIRKLQTEINNITAESDSAGVKILELKDSIDKLSLAIAAVPESLSKKFLDAYNLGNDTLGILESLKSSSDVFGTFGQDIAGIKTADEQREIKAYEKSLKDLSKSMTVLKDQTDLPQLAKFAEGAVTAAEALSKLKNEIRDRRIEQFAEFFTKRVETSGTIFELLQKQSGKIDFLKNQETRGGSKFGKFEELQSELNAVKQEALEITKDLNNQSNLGLNSEEQLAYTKANQVRQQELLGRAKDLELAKAEEILKIEADITEERIQQRKEAQQALGLLSSEDKARVLTQAAFFNKNPNKKLSTLDQFLASEEENKIFRLFGKHIQQGFDPNKKFDKFLLSAGIGGEDVDTARAGERIGKIFKKSGGREKLLEGANKRAQELIRIQQQAAGKELPSEVGDAFDLPGDLASRIKVSMKVNASDFAPLIDTFRDVTQKELLNMRKDLMREIRDIWDALRAVPGIDDLAPGRSRRP